MKSTTALLCCCAFAAILMSSASGSPAPKSYPGLKYLGRGERGLDSSQPPSDYYASVEELNWAQAAESCIRLTRGDGALVAIESAAEDRTLHTLIRSSDVAKIGEYLWTSGAYETVKREWIWVSVGEPTAFGPHTNWKDGKDPVFAPATARVAYESFDAINNHWVMRADDQELHFYICEIKN